MQNDFQKFIGKYRDVKGRARVKAGVALARAKAEDEKVNAALELFVDTMRQEGVDPLSAEGLHLLQCYGQSQEQRRSGTFDELDQFDKELGFGGVKP